MGRLVTVNHCPFFLYMTTFIETYSDALQRKTCRTLVEWFENNQNFHEKQELGYKKSTDALMLLESNAYPSRVIIKCVSDCLVKYKQKYEVMDAMPHKWSLINDYRIQRYYPNEGYSEKHFEHSPKNYPNRMMVWMLYLNTVRDGGTRFPQHDLTVEADEGKMVLWPAYWTHVHHGIVSSTETKYIATGWFEFIKE